MSKVAARFARRRAGRPGFTLTEVAVSVAIVAGLTAAVAVGVNAVSSEASGDGVRYASSKGSMDEVQQSVADQLGTSGAAPALTSNQLFAVNWFAAPIASRSPALNRGTMDMAWDVVLYSGSMVPCDVTLAGENTQFASADVATIYEMLGHAVQSAPQLFGTFNPSYLGVTFEPWIFSNPAYMRMDGADVTSCPIPR